MMFARLHPDHVAMAAFVQPLAQAGGGLRRGVGARDAAGDETQLRRFRLDARLDAGLLLVLRHVGPLPHSANGDKL